MNVFDRAVVFTQILSLVRFRFNGLLLPLNCPFFKDYLFQLGTMFLAHFLNIRFIYSTMDIHLFHNPIRSQSNSFAHLENLLIALNDHIAHEVRLPVGGFCCTDLGQKVELRAAYMRPTTVLFVKYLEKG